MIAVEFRHMDGSLSIFHSPTLVPEPVLLRALQLPHTTDQDFMLEPTSLAHTHPLTTPYEDCFRWDDVVLKLLDATDDPLYCVIFRSVRNVDADTHELYLADAEAHEEARKGGGLLKYWYGTLNSRRECLATCIWSSRESARAALGRPAHAHAMKLASKMYQTYTLERCWLRRGQGRADGKKIVFEKF